MKLSVALTSRSNNSGGVNFLDDVRSFRMNHDLIGETSPVVGTLQFTFYIGEKMSKTEIEIKNLMEIDILEIEDELAARYIDAIQSQQSIEGLLSIIDDEKSIYIQFLDMVIHRDKYGWKREPDPTANPNIEPWNVRVKLIKDVKGQNHLDVIAKGGEVPFDIFSMGIEPTSRKYVIKDMIEANRTICDYDVSVLFPEIVHK